MNLEFKVAIIDHVGSKAGMNYYSTSLMNALGKKGAVSYIFSNYTDESNNNNIKYYNYFDGYTDSKQFIRFLRFLKSIVISSWTAKKNDLDLVITHIFSTQLIGFLLVLIPRLFNKNIAIIVHDINSYKHDDNKCYRYIIFNYLAKYIIVHNKNSYDELFKTSKINNNSKIYIIKHGGYQDYFSHDFISTDKAKSFFCLDSKKKYILFFGQLKSEKGLDILLNAMNKIDDNVNLIIAGKFGATDFAKYENIIRNNDIVNRVIIINKFINDNELPILFKSTKLIILPYRRIYQSGVLMMAMSLKLPVLVSDLPSFKEIISHEENGLLFKNGDPVDLATKITKYINNKRILSNISENAYQTLLEKYSWEDIANKYLHLLNMKN